MGVWTHDYPIPSARPRTRLVGLDRYADEVFEMMRLYPQTSQRRPSVEYIPMPYGPQERRDERQLRPAPQRMIDG